MGNPHEPLASLGPVAWNDLPQDDLPSYVNDIFAQAMVVVESIPSPASAAAPPAGRARAKTESAVNTDSVQLARALRQPVEALEAAATLRKDWKEVKVNPKENPLGINVYKLSSKDGKGAWFARQSIHEGLSFDDWRAGLEREFAESLKVQGSPGIGNIRGIGADRHVEDKQIENAGNLSVFQLSAQFPGPTSPRDFITMLITSDLSHKAQNKMDGLRQYVIVSKPCNHDECPPRQGIIRGQYESVEIIREIHVDPPTAKRSMSAIDMANGDNAASDAKSNGSDRHPDKRPVAVEWLMITRSDPGGSVPRFLIEKGTPPGIVGDAGKFVKWVTAKTRNGWKESEPQQAATTATTDAQPDQPTHSNNTKGPSPIRTINQDYENRHGIAEDEQVPSSNGLYGIITGIFGVASSVVANGLGLNYGSSEESLSTIPGNANDADDGTESDTSSVRSFLSALEKRLTLEEAQLGGAPKPEGSHSEDSKSTTTTNNQNAPTKMTSGERELRKLQERRRKVEDKMAAVQSRAQSRSQGDRAKDEAALAKLREKLEKEAAKQEHKYQRELHKIDEKREHEARKAEQKRRKTLEKEEKSNMALELERTRAERDVALQHNRLLEGQVRELQAQNTQLVAKMGRLGGAVSPSGSAQSIPGAVTTEKNI